MSVEELWRYPVKSMAGESLLSLMFGERGGSGDRTLALIDAQTGRIGSAKLPRRWGRLIDCTAKLACDGSIAVQFPDSTVLDGPSEALDIALSELLGIAINLVSSVPVDAEIDRYWPDVKGLALQDTETTGRIAAAAPGTFFDHAPVHLITTVTLATMQTERSGIALDARRFRPNIVIDSGPGDDPFPENAWVGHDLLVGDLRLRVTDPTPRCVVPTLPHGDLPPDPGLLRRIAARNTVAIPALNMTTMPTLGVYASVVTPGTVSTGDNVRLVRTKPIRQPSDPSERGFPTNDRR